jgi:hypothetical protein
MPFHKSPLDECLDVYAAKKVSAFATTGFLDASSASPERTTAMHDVAASISVILANYAKNGAAGAVLPGIE